MAFLLVEAIKQKYCPEEEDDLETLATHKPVKETATVYRPGRNMYDVNAFRNSLFVRRCYTSEETDVSGPGQCWDHASCSLQ